MIESKVQMDGFEQTLNCLYDPSNQYWNGFANPYFDQTNFDKWVAWLKQEESDTYDEVKDMPSEIINGKKYYYCGGAYIWSYVEENKCQINQLTDLYVKWCENNNIKNPTSADEVILREELSDTQREWLEKFIESWDMAMDVDRYIYDQNKKLKEVS